MNTEVYPKPIQKLINFYKKLPGIGEKNAERMALATYMQDNDELQIFADTIANLKESLTNCKICGHLATSEICDICQDNTRDKNLICIVEDDKSVFKFENVGN